MNHSVKFKSFIYLLAAIATGISSCKKDNSLATTTSDASTTTASTITVASSSTLRTTDSLYVMQPCPRGAARDSISQSELPASVSSYLAANYAGFTFSKAYSIKSNAGVILGYVAIIYFNDKPVGVAFDASGNFVKVLEQRERGDLSGMGWHHGGRFEDRGGIIKDTVALNALPATITSYLSGTYPADTLLKAFTNRDSSYIVLSKNKGLFASFFTSGGVFVKRAALPSKPEVYQIKDQTTLSATILAYLDTTYPNYTFKKAFALSLNNVVKAYIVIIDANNTKYAVEFDSTGTFVRVKALF